MENDAEQQRVIFCCNNRRLLLSYALKFIHLLYYRIQELQRTKLLHKKSLYASFSEAETTANKRALKHSTSWMERVDAPAAPRKQQQQQQQRVASRDVEVVSVPSYDYDHGGSVQQRRVPQPIQQHHGGPQAHNFAYEMPIRQDHYADHRDRTAAAGYQPHKTK